MQITYVCGNKEGATMKVLMLGWEFPPFFAGGIGIVCYELTKALAQNNDLEVTYIMPFGPRNANPGFLKQLITAENMVPKVKVHTVKTTMHAYMGPEEYLSQQEIPMLESKDSSGDNKSLYGKTLMQEVHNFAHRAMTIADFQEFDVIHCHDWMTIPAAVGIKQQTGKPLIVHVHNTIYDRYLNGSNQVEFDIEKRGIEEADTVVCVSNYVRQRLIDCYQPSNPDKVIVVHNAAQKLSSKTHTPPRIAENDKIVLFAGRITAQKGPEYFLHAARLVADHDPNIKFVMAGSGDMLTRMIDLAAELGLADKVLFPGFYTRDDMEKLFGMADVFVMPSVSEPFGIVPLEAMAKSKPTIISNQSGVSEVLTHVLKVDFWDTEEMAEKILAVLYYEELHGMLSKHGNYEVNQLTWDKTAKKMKQVYYQTAQVQVIQ